MGSSSVDDGGVGGGFGLFGWFDMGDEECSDDSSEDEMGDKEDLDDSNGARWMMRGFQMIGSLSLGVLYNRKILKLSTLINSW